MEYLHIKDIDFASNINQRVFGIFLAGDVDVRFQKDGVTKFIDLKMCDRDFILESKKFGASESEINMVQNGGVYRAAIDVKPYAKSSTGYSCNIYNIEPHNEPAANFIEWTDGMDSAQEIIQKALNVINESIYNKLVYNIISEVWGKFCVWTAASSLHHSALGGLMVHTAEVIDQAEQIADFWENKYGPNFINKPLLLSAALLHDVAKTKELNVDTFSGSTEYSVQACLETHITMCVSMIDIEAYKLQLGYQTYKINELNEHEGTKTNEQLEYEQEAVSLLKHCILAHHGKKEWGSPISMNCPEAYIVNMADNISAEMFRYNKNFNSMKSGTVNTVWLSGDMVSTYKDSTK
jgi:3'-5' exoribonuclease